jgi:DNA-binding response OmpR family regulator
MLGMHMSPRSILIVDEDRNLCHSFALILRRAGYLVETAASAAEVLYCLQAHLYDLTILDMMLPDGTSILLPRLLKLYPHSAFIVLTYQAGLEIPIEINHLGVHSRLVKPITPEALLERVKAVFEDPLFQKQKISKNPERR